MGSLKKYSAGLYIRLVFPEAVDKGFMEEERVKLHPEGHLGLLERKVSQAQRIVAIERETGRHRKGRRKFKMNLKIHVVE